MSALVALRRLAMTAFVAASLASIGCVSSTKVYVTSTQQTNEGSTIYMMVRNLDGASAATERYQDAAGRLFADPPDPSVISSQPIIPGNSVTVTLNEAETKGVVLYFFFSQPPSTQPDMRWRVPLPKPLPAEVYIDLGRNAITRVQIRKR